MPIQSKQGAPQFYYCVVCTQCLPNATVARVTPLTEPPPQSPSCCSRSSVAAVAQVMLVLVRRPRRRPASARTRPVAARDVGRSFAAAVVTVYNIFLLGIHCFFGALVGCFFGRRWDV
jgi:hypothetical protein